MKYQSIVSLGLAALGSASPVFHHKDNGQCPPGYSPSVYYITVTAEVAPTSTSSVELTTAVSSSTSTTSTSETTVSTTQTPIQQTYQTLVEMPAPVATEAPVTSEAEAAPVETTVAAEPSTTSSSVQQQPTVVVVSSEPPAAAPAPSTTEAEVPVVAVPTTTQAATTQAAKTQAAKPAVTTAASSSSNSNSNAGSSSSSSSSSSSGTSGATNSGKATFYGGNVSGGACSFSGYTIPSSLFGTALSQARWDDAASCGACVSVKGPDGNSVKAMIVDKCPECESNHLDLFETAFSELAATSEGIIPISWSFVPCGIDSPITLKNKEGTSAYWFSMQVVNSNEPVEKLEVSTDGGSTWQATTRSDYNFFENESGFGTESVDVKVTAKSGGVVTVKNVACQSGVEKEASGNF